MSSASARSPAPPEKARHQAASRLWLLDDADRLAHDLGANHEDEPSRQRHAPRRVARDEAGAGPHGPWEVPARTQQAPARCRASSHAACAPCALSVVPKECCRQRTRIHLQSCGTSSCARHATADDAPLLLLLRAGEAGVRDDPRFGTLAPPGECRRAPCATTAAAMGPLSCQRRDCSPPFASSSPVHDLPHAQRHPAADEHACVLRACALRSGSGQGTREAHAWRTRAWTRRLTRQTTCIGVQDPGLPALSALLMKARRALPAGRVFTARVGRPARAEPGTLPGSHGICDRARQTT